MKCLMCPRTDIRARQLCNACYQRHTYKLKAYGKFDPTYVDAAPVQSYILELRESGMGYQSIANQSGQLRKTVAGLKHRTLCHRDVAAAILAVPFPVGHELHADYTNVPALGSARRLQALGAMGYTCEDLAPHCDTRADVLRRIRGGRQELVIARTARIIDSVFRELQLFGPRQDGYNIRAIRYAQRNGWVLPFAWDEDTIDDPNATPIIAEDAKDAWYDDYLELRTLGKNDHQIAERWGLKYDTLMTKIRRHHASTSSNQEHQQVRQGDEQMVREDWQGMAAV